MNSRFPPSSPEETPTSSASKKSGGDGWVVFSACCFSTIPIFGVWGYRSGAALVPFMAWRFILAVGLLWILLFWTGKARRLPWMKVLQLLGLGLVYALMTLIYFEALRFAAVSTLTLVFYSYPVLVALLGSMFLGERLTRAKTLALGLALAGCVLVLGPEEVGNGWGAGLAFGASVIYSCYFVLGKRLTREVEPWLMTTWILTSSGLVFVVVALGEGSLWLQPGLDTVGAVVGMAIVATILADLTLFTGLSRIGAGRAAILSTVEPLGTLLLSALLLGEAIPLLRLLGGALVLGGVFLVHRQREVSSPAGPGKLDPAA